MSEELSKLQEIVSKAWECRRSQRTAQATDGVVLETVHRNGKPARITVIEGVSSIWFAKTKNGDHDPNHFYITNEIGTCDQPAQTEVVFTMTRGQVTDVMVMRVKKLEPSSSFGSASHRGRKQVSYAGTGAWY